jgi:hypothetical protein
LLPWGNPRTRFVAAIGLSAAYQAVLSSAVLGTPLRSVAQKRNNSTKLSLRRRQHLLIKDGRGGSMAWFAGAIGGVHLMEPSPHQNQHVTQQ